jgi:hypothetical protein
MAQPLAAPHDSAPAQAQTPVRAKRLRERSLEDGEEVKGGGEGHRKVAARCHPTGHSQLGAAREWQQVRCFLLWPPWASAAAAKGARTGALNHFQALAAVVGLEGGVDAVLEVRHLPRRNQLRSRTNAMPSVAACGCMWWLV